MGLLDREGDDDGRSRRRLLLLLLLLLLVVIGAGIGGFVPGFGPPAQEPSLEIEGTPTPTPAGPGPSPTETPGTGTPGPSPSPTTAAGTPTPTTVRTPTPTGTTVQPTPTATPGATTTPPGTPPASPTATPPATPTATPPPTTTPPPDDEFDLTFDGDAVILDYEGLAPGATGSETVTLSNSGTVGGNLSIASIDATGSENGIVGGEAAADDSPAIGELGQHLRLAVSVTYPNGTTVALYGTGDGPRSVATLAAIDERSAAGVVPPGADATVTVDWVLPAATSNVVQSDTVAVEVTFELRAEES